MSPENPGQPNIPWRLELPEPDSGIVKLLKSELGIGRYLAIALASRGFQSAESANEFLYPEIGQLENARLLPDFEAALAVITQAIEGKERIFVHGDYDVDGFTSTTIICRSLTKLGALVEPFVPQRRDGYGIRPETIKRAHELGCKVLLTCDCGTNDHDAISLAKEFGMKVVVTDHHLAKLPLPPADAIINPHRPDSKYPCQDLSGAGVAFKFMLGVSRHFGCQDKFAQAYIELAAIGTIADVVPLRGENRVISTLGIQKLFETKKVGLQLFLSMANAKRTNYTSNSRRGWGSLIGFNIAPRLNSGSRVGNANLPLQLLMTNDSHEAEMLYKELEEANSLRRSMAEAVTEELKSRVTEQPNFIVEGDESWNPSIVGIAAGRIAEQWNRPAIVFGWDPQVQKYKGSMRTLGLLDAAESIKFAGQFLSGGGHAASAGAAIINGSVEDVRAALTEFAKQNLDPGKLVKIIRPSFEVNLSDFTVQDCEELTLLEPFGAANPPVTALLRDVTIQWKQSLGAEGQFLKVQVKDKNLNSASLICWDPHGLQLLNSGDKVSLLVEPSINEFRGERSLQWVVRQNLSSYPDS